MIDEDVMRREGKVRKIRQTEDFRIEIRIRIRIRYIELAESFLGIWSEQVTVWISN